MDTHTSNVPVDSIGTRPARGYLSVEDTLKIYERDLVQSILTQTAEEIKRSTDARINEMFEVAWDRDRQVWARELASGNARFLGVASTPQSGARSAAVTTLPFSESSKHLAPKASLQRSRFPGHNLESLPGIESSLLDPSFVQAHWSIVRAMAESPDNKTIENTIEQLSRITERAVAHSRTAPLLGYASAWQLVACLSQNPTNQTAAALSHFCRQFLIYVTDTVRRAQLAGQNVSSSFSNSLAAKCDSFCRLRLGDTNSPWPVVYYCLRCGDAVAAASALPDNADPVVRNNLRSMAKAQGSEECVWESSSPIRLADRISVLELLESAKRAETPDVHYMGVLTFLSGGDDDDQPIQSEMVEGFKTMEDYMTGALWMCMLQPNPVDNMIKMGETIMNAGETHLDDPGSGGWSFALPLLATQQYEKALSCLAEAGGLMGLLQAVHIGLVLTGIDIPVRNLGGKDNLPNEGTLATLLVAYSSELVSKSKLDVGALASLGYLSKIPNPVRARKEVAKLIATTGEMDALVGTLNVEGMRQGGSLSELFPASEVSKILVEASIILSAMKGDRHKTGLAVMCLMLAERYGDVLSMLNDLLCPTDKQDGDRQFWIEQVKSFHSHYLERRTHVLDVLEREKKDHLIHTSKVLLDLNKFFECLSHGRPEAECSSILEKLRLLPTSTSDRKTKEREYMTMDPLVRDSYPALLVGAMDLLHKENMRLKRGMNIDQTGVVRERLKELQATSRLYYDFAATCVGIGEKEIGMLTELASLII
jgi:hypothetical protein